MKEEAEICRRKAVRYVGQPEAPFLLRIASEFDRLAEEGACLLRRKVTPAERPGGTAE